MSLFNTCILPHLHRLVDFQDRFPAFLALQELPYTKSLQAHTGSYTAAQTASGSGDT